jgi:hypothetical protein
LEENEKQRHLSFESEKQPEFILLPLQFGMAWL